MSTMENSAWLFELLSDHDETLSSGAFDEIVAELDEQSEQARQLTEQRAELLEALRWAEAALADIGDADREDGDDLSWCERRAAKNLSAIRAAIANATQQHKEPGA